jgi:putative acetyltransferase
MWRFMRLFSMGAQVVHESGLEAVINIREETTSDVDAIAHVTIAAFREHPYSRQTEQFIIQALRKAGALTLSLVAEIDGRIVGHAAFSPVTVCYGTPHWYGLGPISVLPERQKEGIGSALMTAGLSRLKDLGAQGCVLVGDPRYYARFGFRNDPALVHDGVPQEVFLALPFISHVPQGRAIFHQAFQATA